MPDMDAWMGDAFPLAGWTGADSSRDVARMIADRPTSIIVDRAGEALAVQTVRIEALGQPRQAAGPAGVTVVAEALVIGSRPPDHRRHRPAGRHGSRWAAGS